jgi:membrane associated rhomboid family serine protease
MFSDPTTQTLMSTVMEDVLVGLLIVALGIFAWLATISRNIRAFQFQISVFIIIWIAGELVDMIQGDQLVTLFGTSSMASLIHVGAMIFFSAMIWLRFISARARGRKMVDDVPPDYLIDK